MPNKFYSIPKSVFEHYHAKLKDWVMSVLPTKTSDLTNDSDFLDQLALAGIIASNFSTSSTYAVGDYVLYNHTLYRCKTAISTAGAWDSSKWDATKTQDIFQGSAPGLVPAVDQDGGDGSKALLDDGTWGVVSGGSTARVSYNAQTEELHLDFGPPPIVNIGGRNYSYVQIGNQLWLTENLDWKFDGLTVGGTWSTGNPSAWYYNNDESTYGVNGNKYGLMYDNVAVAALNNGILPTGWKVPTILDWITLVEAVSTTGTGPTNNNAGLKLKTVAAGGTDDYGMSLVLCGMYNRYGFSSIDSWGGYHCTDNINMRYVQLGETTDYINTSGMANGNALPIRLVKDVT